MVRVYDLEYIIKNLNPSTEYDVYVRLVCSDDKLSNWQRFDLKTTDLIGIDGVEGDYVLRVYPNPTTKGTNIYLQGVEGNVVVSVVDMSGRLRVSREVECGGGNEVNVRVDYLEKGTYFVRVLGDDINSVRKLIVW